MMTRLLPAVLNWRYLPIVELSAARLDGELFAVDECFQMIDLPEDAVTRGHALAASLPPRLIAEQRTAAWVYGALDKPPPRHELCAASEARFRALGAPRWSIREVVIDPGELWKLGGMQVTTPLRTIVDLARFSVDFAAAEQRMVFSLAALSCCGLPEIVEAIDRRRNLPGKRRALDRLTTAFDEVELSSSPPPNTGMAQS